MLNRVFFIMVAIGVPFSLLGGMLHWSETMMFGVYCLSIIALSAYLGRATESLAIVMGPRIGGLFNATFGNAVELIISIFALQSGMVEVVLASLTGSIIGNLLLVGGLSFVVGGTKFKRQSFNVYDAKNNATMLIFAIIVAFVIPEVFSKGMDESDSYVLSFGISAILIGLYLASMFFKLVTHRGVYQINEQNKEDDEEEEEPEWSKGKAITILALSTLAVGIISEHLVDTLETVSRSFGWSELFIGIIIVAIVGNAAEHASAVMMAYKNKVDISIEIAVGSSLQIAMFVVPVLVILSPLFGLHMALAFSWPELVAMITAVFLMNSIIEDGDTNWFEGAMLLASYAIVGIGFYLI